MVSEGGANLDHMGSVRPNGLVEEVAGDMELLRPVGDIGGDFRVDGVRVGGNLVAVLCSRLFDGGGRSDDVRDGVFLVSCSLRWMWMRGKEMSRLYHR